MDIPPHSGKVVLRPKALVCHICGREFGTKSLAFHLKACTKKWEDAQALLPKRERRPVPKPPSETLGGLSQAGMDERNAAAMKAFEEQAMKQCPHCSRTFLEDRLPIHLRSCTAENPHKGVNRQPDAKPDVEEIKSSPAVTSSVSLKAKTKAPVSEYASPAVPEYAEVCMQPCSLCGRNFAEDRLAKHEAVCQKAGKKQRRVFQSAAKRVVDPLMAQPSAQDDVSRKDKGKWKREHDDFINAMKYSKQVTKAQQAGIDVRTIPAPASTSSYSDYVHCPHCGRNFAPQTAERHIPRCQDIVNKPKPPPSRLMAPGRSAAALSGSPQPKAKSPSAMSRTARPATQALAKSSTEATFRKVLKACPSCKQMMPETTLQEHMQTCVAASVKTLRPPGTAAAKRSPTHSSERAKAVARTEQPAPGTKSFCPMCGERFLADAKFCVACGARR